MLVGHDVKNVHRRHESFHALGVVGAIIADLSAAMAPAIVPGARFVYRVLTARLKAEIAALRGETPRVIDREARELSAVPIKGRG
jgi:hypothetical protein